MRCVPAWLIERPIAHRGLHDRTKGRPENSLAAFAAAAEGGYPIELDVRLSRDGAVMVFHDERLDRLTQLEGRFDEFDRAALTDARLLGSDQSIPTLNEVLTTVAGKAPIAIEVKSFYGNVGPCEAATLEAMRAYGGEWLVQSFNPFSLAWFARHAPDVIRGQISGALANWSLPWSEWRCHQGHAYETLWLSRPDFLCHDCTDLPNAVLGELKSRGYPLTSYTVRDHDTRRRLGGIVDNIIFEEFVPD